MTKKQIYLNFNELLQEKLKDPNVSTAYLNEALQDKDPNVFLIALKDVLEAQNSDISAIAKKTHISRQSFYRMLSSKGNPRWNNITSLIEVMGFQVQLSYTRPK